VFRFWIVTVGRASVASSQRFSVDVLFGYVTAVLGSSEVVAGNVPIIGEGTPNVVERATIAFRSRSAAP
jgi:hypothetical protein